MNRGGSTGDIDDVTMGIDDNDDGDGGGTYRRAQWGTYQRAQVTMGIDDNNDGNGGGAY